MGIGFVGYGRMGSALAKSIAASGVGRESIFCLEASAEARKRISDDGLAVAADYRELVEKSGTIFVCVKPNGLGVALNALKPLVTSQIIISIAAGKKISWIESVLGNKKIVRVMPNIAALASESMSVFTAKNLSTAEKKQVESLLCSFGVALELEEAKFDAVTALSGSGPAFVAHFAECLAEAGAENGLDKNIAKLLAVQTVFGTAKLLKVKKISTKQVIELVSSPGGTTIAGMQVLESGEFASLVKRAISAAKKRAEEMGKGE